jgi:hypothetical protein
VSTFLSSSCSSASLRSCPSSVGCLSSDMGQLKSTAIRCHLTRTPEVGTWGVHEVENAPRSAWAKTDAASVRVSTDVASAVLLTASVFTHALRGTLCTLYPQMSTSVVHPPEHVLFIAHALLTSLVVARELGGVVELLSASVGAGEADGTRVGRLAVGGKRRIRLDLLARLKLAAGQALRPFASSTCQNCDRRNERSADMNNDVVKSRYPS